MFSAVKFRLLQSTIVIKFYKFDNKVIQKMKKRAGGLKIGLKGRGVLHIRGIKEKKS